MTDASLVGILNCIVKFKQTYFLLRSEEKDKKIIKLPLPLLPFVGCDDSCRATLSLARTGH